MPDAITALIGPRPRAALLDELARDVDLGAKLVVTGSAMVAGAALYGAALGLWRGGAQVAYAAIKLPLVLIVTAALTMVFNWMAAVLLGLQVRFAQVAVLSYLALGVAAQWARAFRDLYREPPDWYHGHALSTFNSHILVSNLNSMSAETHSVMQSAPRSAQGSSFSGGGISGGGGFSGGGFGGGGGGAF